MMKLFRYWSAIVLHMLQNKIMRRHLQISSLSDWLITISILIFPAMIYSEHRLCWKLQYIKKASWKFQPVLQLQKNLANSGIFFLWDNPITYNVQPYLYWLTTHTTEKFLWWDRTYVVSSLFQTCSSVNLTSKNGIEAKLVSA